MMPGMSLEMPAHALTQPWPSLIPGVMQSNPVTAAVEVLADSLDALRHPGEEIEDENDFWEATYG